MNPLYLKQIQVGPMANYTYLLGCQETGQCLVVDPAWDIEQIMNTAAADEMTISGVLVSHYHPDHVGGSLWGHDIAGVKQLLEKIQVPVYANKLEIPGLQMLTGLQKGDFKAVDGGETIDVGKVGITCIHTPGHTPGSQCFLCQEMLVSGDTLFLSGCGRVDLPGGNSDDLYHSLTQKLAKLPDQTIVFPGHHYDKENCLNLGEVKKRNPYLNVKSSNEWHNLRD